MASPGSIATLPKVRRSIECEPRSRPELQLVIRAPPPLRDSRCELTMPRRFVLDAGRIRTPTARPAPAVGGVCVSSRPCAWRSPLRPACLLSSLPRAAAGAARAGAADGDAQPVRPRPQGDPRPEQHAREPGLPLHRPLHHLQPLPDPKQVGLHGAPPAARRPLSSPAALAARRARRDRFRFSCSLARRVVDSDDARHVVVVPRAAAPAVLRFRVALLRLRVSRSAAPRNQPRLATSRARVMPGRRDQSLQGGGRVGRDAPDGGRDRTDRRGRGRRRRDAPRRWRDAPTATEVRR